MSTYAVSDLHGHYNLFLRGLKEIAFSDDDYLWCLGDAIDRGPDGIKILEHIMKHNNMDMLIGNHECMMLNSVSATGKAIANGDDANLWLNYNGGDLTFLQYEELFDEERIELLNWLRNRYVIKTLTVNDQDFCLTHSFYHSNCENKTFNELSYYEVWRITWASIWRHDPDTHAEDIYPDYPYNFILGHVPVHRIRESIDRDENWNRLKAYHHNNVVNIDGGCGMGFNGFDNGAIFLRLDDMKEFGVRFENAGE
ncbi:MAG: fructose-bisphosphatase class III [Lachnospiraceae bacterium]|nr:fructose-bisphosphatase class III [Lachnospiraceae bacterium]